MIRKHSARILSLVMVLYFVFLTLFGLGDYLYPDTICVPVGEEVEDRLCFSFSQGEEREASSLTESLDCQVLAFGFLPVKSVRVHYYPKTEVILGGELFGVRIQTKGLVVTALSQVETEAGPVSPGEACGIRKGDVLMRAGGVELTDAADLAKIISRCGGSAVEVELERNGKTETLSLHPARSADGSGYKAGLWVRDGAAGIGTVTFRDPVSGAFAGLGHAVCDSESGVIFPLKAGSVCHARIEGIVKGENGSPGEIRGALESDSIGELFANTASGVYGTMPVSDEREDTVPLGNKEQVKTGKATLLCTLDQNGKKEYEIEIEEILSKDRENKNFVLCIKDPALLEKTGGIVQGMSGSPIIQDGKLIGAVTHVLVGDPTRGYGIFIENMLSGMPE